MLFYDFKNYEEFNELFGIVEHGNGVKSRKNKILLSLYKDKLYLRNHIQWKNYVLAGAYMDRLRESIKGMADSDKNVARKRGIYEWYRAHHLAPNLPDLLVGSLNSLKNILLNRMQNALFFSGPVSYGMYLHGRRFLSDKYYTDSFNGLCEDGTLNAIRYINSENDRVFKMKAGKMFNHLMDCNDVTKELPEQVRRWLSEEFVAEWVEYARENIGETEYTLHVDDNFERIYTKSACVGNGYGDYSFGSCMASEGQWEFYCDAVEAKAAYLTDKDDKVVARCVVFTDVTDEDGKTWRLAERQYSAGSRPELQRQLVNALIKGGHIDGYKQVGSSCGDSRNFVDINGNALNGKCFSISCNLEPGDTLSYQDSFKWYDYNDNTAYNYSVSCCDDLGVTDPTYREESEYSDYHDEHIPSEDATYVETRGDWFYNDECVYAENRCEDCFRDDCILIGHNWYYAGENAEYPDDYGIAYCENCDEYFVAGEGYYSEITEEEYCCPDCRAEAELDYKEKYWEFATWDEEYYEQDVLAVLMWDSYLNEYREMTIYFDHFNELVAKHEAVEYDGEYYIDFVNMEGEPVHLAMQEAAA